MFNHETIIGLIENYGLVFLFLVAVIEGPIVAAIAGYLIGLGHLEWASVIIILILADLLGDAIYYWLGSNGRSKHLAKLRKKTGLDDGKLADMKTRFESHGGRLILFGKFAHAPGLVINLSAGLSHMNFPKFMLYSLLGTIPKSILFVAIGYALGAAFGNFSKYLSTFTWVSIALIFIAVFAWIFMRKAK